MSEALTPAEVSALKQEIAASLHCALPGIVEAYDPEMQTAAVRPAVAGMPLLRDVPVFFPGSRDSGITWPVAAGDECLLLFADGDIDKWFETGAANEADSRRQHSLSDAFAFVGFRSRENALQDLPEEPAFFGIRPADVSHTHDDRYYTESETDTKLAGKSDTGHTHDGRYYTESEMDTKLSGKSDTGHTHDSRYYTESETDTKLAGKKNTQTAVSDPAASGTTLEFISSISQNIQGVISPAKKSVKVANNLTTTAAGSVLDARQGKALKDAVDTVDGKIFTSSLSGSNLSDKSIANNTVVNLGSVTLTKGLYLLFGTATFASNATGYRRLIFANSATGTSADRFSVLSVGASQDGITQLQLCWVANVTAASSVVYLNARQTSGGALNVTYPGIRYVKLS